MIWFAKPKQFREAGFTLVEVLVALLIVATTIATLQTISNATLRSAVETNRLRVAKMLLRAKAEEVAAGIEQGSAGQFDGFPGYDWEVVASEVPIDTSGASQGQTGQPNAQGAATQPESVISVTVSVRMPHLGGTTDPSETAQSEDGPGVVRVTTLLTPPDAKLLPPAGAAGQANPAQPGRPGG